MGDYWELDNTSPGIKVERTEALVVLRRRDLKVGTGTQIPDLR